MQEPQNDGGGEMEAGQNPANDASLNDATTSEIGMNNPASVDTPSQSILAVFKHPDHPRRPIIWPLGKYGTVVNLQFHKAIHNHPEVHTSVSQHSFADFRKDRSNWSKLKKIYLRLGHVAAEKEITVEDAAAWMDKHERKATESINKYYDDLSSNPIYGGRYTSGPRAAKKRKRVAGLGD